MYGSQALDGADRGAAGAAAAAAEAEAGAVVAAAPATPIAAAPATPIVGADESDMDVGAAAAPAWHATVDADGADAAGRF